MINLLPEETKKHFSYARQNVTLANWAIAVGIGVIGIVIVIAAGYMYINRSTESYQKQISGSNELLAEQKLDETQKKVSEISDSVRLATQVLSKQVLFSKLLTQISAAIPNGSALQSLSINSTQGGIDLTAVATNYQTATQVQINLSDPANQIFDKADIVNVTCQDDKTVQYPCQVSIRALFAKDNTFQYTDKKESN